MVELFQVLTPRQAKDRLLGAIRPLAGSEEVETATAFRRVLAADLAAPQDLPTVPRSVMDGFAVRAQDTFGASEGLPAYLKVVGEVVMGQPATQAVRVGEGVRIHTGGMLPPGADAVVMSEHTQSVDAQTIEVLRPVAPGENVLQIGEDTRQGAVLFVKGHRLRPQDIGTLMGMGITRIPVARPPRVAILATGDEIVPPEATPGPAQVRDINSYTTAGLVQEAGGVPILLGITPDNRETLRTTARRAMQEADLLVFSAGSSVSTRDITAEVIHGLGRPGVLVHGVALKPGKPTILALCDGRPVFGLPGNPVSSFITFELFVRPALFGLMGCRQPPTRPTVTAYLGRNLASIPGREDYIPARIDVRDGARWAEPIFGKSNLITTLSRADGLIQIPLDVGGLTAGDSVELILFQEAR